MNILLITNNKVDTTQIRDEVQKIITAGKRHTFTCIYEDYGLFQLLRELPNVKWLRALPGAADRFLYSNIHKDIYTEYPLGPVFECDTTIYKRAIKRFPSISKELVLDDKELDARRYAICMSRIRFVVGAVVDSYDMIIRFGNSNADANYMKDIPIGFGDGRVYWNNGKFYVGGIPCTDETFYRYLEEVH